MNMGQSPATRYHLTYECLVSMYQSPLPPRNCFFTFFGTLPSARDRSRREGPLQVPWGARQFTFELGQVRLCRRKSQVLDCSGGLHWKYPRTVDLVGVD